MPDGCVIFGPVLRWGVAPGALWFGRVGVRKTAQTHQDADDERCEHHPRSERVGHLRREEKQQGTITSKAKSAKALFHKNREYYKGYVKVRKVPISFEVCVFVVKLKIKTQQRNRVRNNLLSDLSPDDLTVTSAVHLSCFSPLSSRVLYDLDGHLMRTELTINHTPRL